MDLDRTSKILITCARGISPFLEAEARALGCSVRSAHDTGIVITAKYRQTYALNLKLRTAYNVLFLLEEFKCAGPDDLYNETYAIEWENIIPTDEYISVVSQVDNPTIKNSMFANQKLKDAVCDRLVKMKGKRPNAGPDRKNVVINLYWKNKKAWIYLNTSGVKLADRGYRKIPLEAPMQETLASAVVLATGYNGGGHFINPMCGSGTLAIEAALVALNKAPGLLRSNYGFKPLMGFESGYWQGLRKEALGLARKRTDFRIIATDRSNKAVDAAMKNAKTAGVDHLIEFKVCDFADTTVPSGKGTVVLNPEYGERMGAATKLEATYAGIGDFFKKKCAGYKGYVFTGNPDLARKVGLQAKKRVPFFNGDIECRLLEYDVY